MSNKAVKSIACGLFAVSVLASHSVVMAQVDATGRSVVPSTLAKSDKRQDASGSLDGTVEGFLKKNAGKEFFVLKNYIVIGSRSNERADVKLKFADNGMSASLYTTEGGRITELCTATSINHKILCHSNARVSISTEAATWTVMLFSDKVEIARITQTTTYCTPSYAYRYLLQDTINQGSGGYFTDWVSVTPGVCYSNDAS